MNTTKDSTILSEGIELFEYRPGRFVKVLNGEVTGPVTLGELKCYYLKKTFPGIDAGIIEVSLALTALTGFLATLDRFPVSTRLLLSIAFGLGLYASSGFSWAYVTQRIPNTWTHFYQSPIKQNVHWLPLILWLPFYFLKLFITSLLYPLRTPIQDQNNELTYLSLVMSIFLTEVTLGIWLVKTWG